MCADSQTPVSLVRVPTEMEATLLAGQLEQRGIQAKIVGDFLSGFKAEAPGDVHVMVKQTDLPQAQVALQEIHKENATIDWSQVDLGTSE